MKRFEVPVRSPPVKVDDEYDVTITAKGSRGDGITRIKGFVIFVPGTNVGDEVKIKIEKVFRKFAVAKVLG